MQRNVGIIRTGTELTDALAALDALSERVNNLAVRGGRAYNPGWNLATDLPSMITVSRCTTLGAINRTESRGGHTREDYPTPDAELGKVNFVHSQPSGGGYRGEIKTVPEPIPEMAPDLRALFEDKA
jgi:succinate dehydrogenase / fumarate reductase flavoprotein subunit